MQVTDPNAPRIEERAGAVASDSLAAESTRAGGDFSKNRGCEPLGVAGANSTFANTNTSGADTLEPAPSSQSRKAATDDTNDSYPSAIGGQSRSTATTDTTGSCETGGTISHAGVAPTYVNSQYVDTHGPKGKDLKEGGFDEGDDKNASFTSDIGDENDPGRLAELKFAKENAEMGEDTAPKQGGSGEGLYDVLEDTSA
jgi:hypothetical protein